MDSKRLRVHDLLWISQDSRLFSPEQPQWVRENLTRMPVVVVRRAQAPLNFVSVGVRGGGREQRHDADLRMSDIRACRTPESLAAERGWVNNSAQIPAHLREALAAVSEFSVKHHFVWGPVGSVGYQLATSLPVTTGTSDLDVMICCHVPPGRDQLRSFDEHLRKAPASVDVILEAPLGGVAMREYLNGGEVLSKTSQGARIALFLW